MRWTFHEGRTRFARLLQSWVKNETTTVAQQNNSYVGFYDSKFIIIVEQGKIVLVIFIDKFAIPIAS